LKILLIHNFYRSKIPSGENESFKLEKKILKENGHNIEEFVRNSDEIKSENLFSKLKIGLSLAWDHSSYKSVSKLVDSFKPDIVHVHNTFPLISPSIFYAVKKKAAIVLSLHNYRLFCSNAKLLRSGKICKKCIEKKSVLPAIRYGCYQKSRFATIPLAFKIALHKKLNTWKKKVDAFIVQTEFQKKLMVESELPQDKIYVKPLSSDKTSITPWEERNNTIIFVGRLSEEKGLVTLVKSWILWGSEAPVLNIVGSGELEDELKKMVQKHSIKNINFLGKLRYEDTREKIGKAKLTIFPSEWYEIFGKIIVDSFSKGTPIAVSDIGSLPDLVTNNHNGIVFRTNNEKSLFEEVKKAWTQLGCLEKLSKGAKNTYDQLYTLENSYERTISIYKKVIQNNKIQK
tara:strand:- start:499 stop:1701 length:1203 start_codon:yes stop_codon:yes gene_type:complete